MAKTTGTKKNFSKVLKGAFIAVKNWLTPIRIIGIVCLLLMITLVVTQFLPYWTFGKDNTTVSIAYYNWFPNEKVFTSQRPAFLADIKNQLADAGLMDTNTDAWKKLGINDFVYPHALLMLVSLFGFIFCPFKLGKPLGLAFSLACGGLGVWMHLCHPIYRLGPTWGLGLGISIALTVLALLNIVLAITKALKD